MDRRERVGSLLVAIKAALEGFEAGLWTALPAFVVDYNAAAVTVSAQPTIQAQVRTPGGVWVTTTLPVCQDCPVQFAGGGGFVLTLPLVAGNEGVLVFASRCIDAWWQNSGIQPQAELRMHDLSDGFFFPGGFSQPNVPAGVSATKAQLRNLAGTLSLSLDPVTNECQILAAGGLLVNGVPVTVP